MKLLSALLATFLYSASAHAALEFTFSGDFVNFTSGNFSGQLTFDALSPSSSNFFPASGGESASLRLGYSLSAPLSILVNSQALTIDNDHVVLNILDNATSITDDLIASHGFTGHVTAGIYDMLTLSMESSINQYDDTGSLVSGAEFSVTAFFDQSLLGGADLNPPKLQGLFGLPDPKYFVFEINRKLGDGADYVGAGIIKASDIVEIPVVKPVPLPGAVWLFGSVIAGLGLRMRKQA
ncbi:MULTISPECIES: hypothetical protein [Methylomonas]|uniref:PEP-CTERM protein-sorting domain-containing protein n=2 Tax=Methylomonas TaxID=416 RepID=A0A126T3N3_9GAMM|nr:MULTISPECIES: hypothetical protein [Methylomonas]AMK76689.1 hypothetical protein JT25_009330 [Methylomonas denitrificans]OAI00060.1 hypothetical protein A1342_18755 [Methylomonas methanica]TCV82819.1 hypothetical protein EDE11_11175 [Methylomonas methanica]